MKKNSYAFPQMELVEFILDDIVCASDVDENQGEWDPQ